MSTIYMVIAGCILVFLLITYGSINPVLAMILGFIGLFMILFSKNASHKEAREKERRELEAKANEEKRLADRKAAEQERRNREMKELEQIILERREQNRARNEKKEQAQEIRKSEGHNWQDSYSISGPSQNVQTSVNEEYIKYIMANNPTVTRNDAIAFSEVLDVFDKTRSKQKAFDAYDTFITQLASSNPMHAIMLNGFFCGLLGNNISLSDNEVSSLASKYTPMLISKLNSQPK